MFGSLGWQELLIILVILALVFGASRVADLGGALGRGIREFRSEASTGNDKALSDEGTRKRLLELGSDIPGPDRRGQAALTSLVKSEIDKWTPIIKAAGPM